MHAQFTLFQTFLYGKLIIVQLYGPGLAPFVKTFHLKCANLRPQNNW